jgi:hypothetical protein
LGLVLWASFIGTGQAVQFASGSYVGNGADGRSITGVGFQPDAVIIKGDTAQFAVMRTATMPADSSKELAEPAVLQANRIESLDADGFTVGSDARVNAAGINYFWMAFRDTGAGDFKAGSYAGTGLANRSITGVGFQPDYAIVMRDGTSSAVQRSSAMTGDTTLRFTAASSVTGRIQAMEADGFRVGSAAEVNLSGNSYHYAAWKSVAGKVAVGTYAGNGLDNRSITGVGFSPDYVIVKASTASEAVHRSAAVTGDSTLRFLNSANLAGAIKALEADGFQVGIHATVNSSGTTYFWAAFDATPTKLVVTSVNGGANPTAGTPFAVVVQTQDLNGTVRSVASDTGVALTLKTGSGTLGGTLTGTITTGTSQVTISGATYTKAEGGVALTASRTSGDTLTAGDSATFTVVPGAPASLTKTAGDGQSAQVGNSFATNLQVRVRDSQGNDVADGTAVTFTAPASGASGTFAATGTRTTTVNTTSGLATASAFTANTVAGSYTVTATAGAASVSFSVTNSPGPPATLTKTAGDGQAAQVNTAFVTNLQVRVRDNQGNDVADGTAVTFTAPASGASGTFAATGTRTTTVNTTSGLATASAFTANATAGGYSVTAAAGAASVDFSLTNTLVVPPQLVITSVNGGANPAAGGAFAVVVQAQTAGGSPSNVTADSGVALTLKTGTGTLGGALAGTIPAGQSQVTISGVTYTKAESGVVLTASRTSGDLLTAGDSSAFTVNPGPLDHFALSTIASPRTAGIAFSITITARDALNNTVTGFAGTVALSTTAGTISPATSGNFSAGVRTESVTLTQAGTGQTVTAADGSGHTGTSNAFTVDPGALNNFLVEAAGGGSIAPQTAGVAFNIRITARDALNNTVTSFTGTVQITSNATLQGAPVPSAAFVNGVLAWQAVTVTSAQSGTTLSATDPGSGANGTSNAFTVNPAGLGNFLVEAAGGGNIAPQTAGAAFSIRVTARDGFNNTVTGFTGTVNLTTTAGTISPTSLSFAGTDLGVRTVSVTLTQAGTGKTITAADPATGNTGTSNGFTVNPAALVNFLVEDAPGGNIPPQTAGASFRIRVTARDAFNNTVTGFTGTLTLSTTAGTISPTSLTFGSADLGVRTVLVALTQAGTGKTVTATDPVTANTGTSNDFTVNAGPLDHFGVEAAGGGPIGSQTRDIAFAIRITAQDANNNTVTGFSGAGNTVQITSTGALSAGAGTTATFSNGVLASHSLTIGNTGTFTITATKTGGGASGTSNAFWVTHAAIASYAVSAASPQTAGTAFTVTVTAKDANNNTVTTDSTTAVTLSAVGAVQFDGNGNGTFGEPGDNVKTLVNGTFTIQARDLVAENVTVIASDGNGKTGTTVVAIGAGPVDHFAIGPVASPQTVGVAFPITITAQDAFNNTVTGFTGAVALSTTAGSITPASSGNFTAGTRTLNVVVAAAGAGRTITADDGAGHTGTSNGFTVDAAPAPPASPPAPPTGSLGGAAGGPGPPAVLAKTAGDAQSAQVGTAFAASLQVRVQDGLGLNVRDGTLVTFSAPASGPSAIFVGTATGAITVTTQGGLATASAFIANQIAGRYAVTATSGAAAVTFNLTNTPGPASKLSFTVQPGDATAGSVIPGPPTVTVQDQFGNPVTDSSAAVTVAIGANPAEGRLTGTTTARATGGVARFPDLSLDRPGSGYTLVAGSPGLAVAFSAGFGVTGAGPGPRLARFAIASIPSPQAAGVPFAITIAALDANDRPLTTFTGRLALTTTAGGITPSTSGPFVGGVRTETVVVTLAGPRRTIIVSDGAGHAGTSDPFDVLAGPATRLVFAIPPGDVTAGLPLPGPPTIVVQDSLGNIIGEPPVSVQVALGATQASGSLGGTLTRSTADGVARFDDLVIHGPGSGYTLHASAPGLAPATSPAFAVVRPRSIPAELNRQSALVVTGEPARFRAGDELIIRFQSLVKLRFQQASTLIPEAVTPLTLRLQRGAVDVTADDISLGLVTSHGQVSVQGSAEFRLSTGEETTLDVRLGSVRYIRGAETTVPPGGRLVAGAGGIRSTELRLTQPLLLTLPDAFTFLALWNPSASGADATLTALDAGGNPLVGSANPRTVHLGPGSTGSGLTRHVFGLDAAAPPIGSIRIETSSLSLQGASFLGDTLLERLGSAGLTGQRFSEAVVPEDAGAFLTLVNPGEEPVSVTVARISALGSFAGEIAISVPGHGHRTYPVDGLFGRPPVGGRGSLRLTSPERFTPLVFTVDERDAFPLLAESPDGLGSHLLAPFVVDIPGLVGTTLSLVNASEVPVRATVRLYDATGRPISSRIGSRASEILPAGARSRQDLRELFQFGPNQTVVGWVEVSAVPTFPTTGVRLMGAVSFGDPRGQRFQATLPLSRRGQAEASVPFFVDGDGLFSLIAILNPSVDQIATVTLDAIGLDGTMSARQELRLGPRTNLVGLVRDLLPDLSLPFRGSLRLRSEGAGIIVRSVAGDERLRFLLLLPSQ